MGMDGTRAVLHAMADVFDDEAVFAMLASFTESAVERTVKRGLPVREKTSARTVASHFQSLIARNVLCNLPLG